MLRLRRNRGALFFLQQPIEVLARNLAGSRRQAHLGRGVSRDAGQPGLLEWSGIDDRSQRKVVPRKEFYLSES
jgi:hypothetical protein